MAEIGVAMVVPGFVMVSLLTLLLLWVVGEAAEG